jgi:hypothetical protein
MRIRFAALALAGAFFISGTPAIAGYGAAGMRIAQGASARDVLAARRCAPPFGCARRKAPRRPRADFRLEPITIELLRRFAGPRADGHYLQAIADQAVNVLPRFSLCGAADMQAFFATLALESGGFRSREENLNYSAKRLCQVWPRRFPSIAAAQPSPTIRARSPRKFTAAAWGTAAGRRLQIPRPRAGPDHRARRLCGARPCRRSAVDGAAGARVVGRAFARMRGGVLANEGPHRAVVRGPRPCARPGTAALRRLCGF